MIVAIRLTVNRDNIWTAVMSVKPYPGFSIKVAGYSFQYFSRLRVCSSSSKLIITIL